MSKKNANGENSVYYNKAKKLWQGQLVIGYDDSGKMKKKTVSGKTKTEATQKLKQLEFGIFSGEFVDKSGITIYSLAKQMIEDKFNLNEIKENTYCTHISTLKRLQPIYNTPLQQANETQIRAFFQTRLDKSNSILRKDFELLQKTFKEAIRRKIITENPMEYIKLPKSKQVQVKVRALTVEEQNKLLEILLNEDIKYSGQMILSMFTGMRMGEINALNKKDINIRFKTISVNKTITRGSRGQAILGTSAKTYAGNRIIHISDDILPLISECLTFSDTEMVFTTDSGGLVTTNQVNMELDRIFKKYDIIDKSVSGKVSCHSLRHTYATRMIEAGMQPKVLQQLLGHTDIKITLNTYCDAFEKFENDNLRLADEYLKKSGLIVNRKKDSSEAVKMVENLY